MFQNVNSLEYLEYIIDVKIKQNRTEFNALGNSCRNWPTRGELMGMTTREGTITKVRMYKKHTSILHVKPNSLIGEA